MQKRRVAITGMGTVSPYGVSNEVLLNGIQKGLCPFQEETIKVAKNRYATFPVGKVPYFSEDINYICIPREIDRSMSNLSRYAYVATIEAMEMAKLTDNYIESNHIGIAISSTLPSIQSYEELFYKYLEIDPKSMPSTMAFKTMNHTTSLNIANAFGFHGRCLSPSSACASGLQSVILGYEAIAFGRSKIMVCGGAEEYHPFLTLIFNKLGIASKTSCKPFDVDRDGIVVSEGAGILILEDLELAEQRNAPIIAEVLGVGMSTSGNLAHSDTDSIIQCMNEARNDTHGINPNCINAHATGTQAGDIAEGTAIETLFGAWPVVNSLKGYLGHTMGASGALELIASILGLRSRKEYFFPTHCTSYDKECGHIDVTEGASISHPILLKNSFGLGGINTSVIVKIY